MDQNCFSVKEDDSQCENLVHQDQRPQTKPTAENEVFLESSSRVRKGLMILNLIGKKRAGKCCIIIVLKY